MPPALFFFLKVALIIQGLMISYKFQDFFSVSVENAIGILAGATLNLQTALEKVNSSNPRTQNTFPFICVFNILYLSVYKSFTSLVKLIPRYFIILVQLEKQHYFFKNGNFTGRLGPKILYSQCRTPRFHPWSGNQILHPTD